MKILNPPKSKILSSFAIVIAGMTLLSSVVPLQGLDADKTRVMVCYKSAEVKTDAMDIMETHYDGRLIKEIEKGNLLVYSIPEGYFARFSEDPELMGLTDYMEADHLMQADHTPNDPYWPQWNMQMVDADYTWNVVQGDPSVIVALLDTGVDYNHDDLAANVDESIGWDYVNNDADPMDDEGHGTQVVGIICAEIDNNIGIAGMAQITLMPMKVLDNTGTGWTSDIVDAIYDAGDWGANVISMSFGSYWYSSSLESAVNWAYDTMGIVVVAAAGNDNSNSNHYPAALDNAIGVGAVMSSGSRWYHSNYGDNVEIMAPGVGVWSTKLGNTYGVASGTSIACPHVSGAAALAFSARPTMTNVQIRNVLHIWADDMGTPGYDDYNGYGLLDCWGPID